MDREGLEKLIIEHTAFTKTLYEFLNSLLAISNIRYHTIESRTKTIESLEGKIVLKNIRNVKDEITDISGIRIILYYKEDVDKVTDLVKSNFKIDEKNSINKANLYDDNEFGYLSVHYIVSLPALHAFSTLKAEIQIRTVLQHSWASISHELTYKKNYEIPKELKRKLYRLAGLFELADEQFSKIKEEHNSLEEWMKNESATEKTENSEINLLSLKYNFENKYSISNEIERIALDAGFKNTSVTEEYNNRQLSRVALISDILGYKLVNEIEKNLKLKIGDLKLYFIELINNYSAHYSLLNWYGCKSFYLILAMLFFLNIEQLNEFSERSEWNNEYFDFVKEAISKMNNS